MLLVPLLTLLAAEPAPGSLRPPLSQASGTASESAAARPGADALAEALAASEGELATELEELARSAAAAQLFAFRGRVLERLLLLDPDHALAREVLSYRLRNGSWEREPGARPGRDHNPEALPDHEARFLAAFARHRDKVLALLDEQASALGPLRVRAALARLRELQPEDARVRSLLGEVLEEGRWILRETQRAREESERIEGIVERSLRDAPEPEPCFVEEQHGTIGLRAARCTGRARVLGTVDEEELALSARTVHAATSLVEELFEVETRSPAYYSVYLLRGPDEGRELLEHWPGLPPATRELLATVNGGWLGSARNVADWSASADRRLDGATRQTIGMLITDTWGVDWHDPWLWEGLGAYLVERLLGTRLTWFVEEVEGGSAPRSTRPRVQRRQMGFVGAHDLYREGRAPSLAVLIGVGANAMTGAQREVSFALAGFLLEGRPESVPAILSRVGADEHPTEVLEDELGLALPVLEELLRGWVCERSHAGARCAPVGAPLGHGSPGH